MPSNKRDLIIYQPPGFLDHLCADLSSHDWNVYTANNFQQLSDLTAQHSFKAGLCLIEDTCTHTTCLIGKLCLIDNCKNDGHLAQLHRLFNLHSRVSWVMCIPKECMQGDGSNLDEIKILAEYCHDFIAFPATAERVSVALGNAYTLNAVSQAFHEQIDHYPSPFGIIGNSSPMVKLFSLLKKVANENCSVLIEGETGTGKELVASAIHSHSSRSAKPFVAINCGAFPRELIQTELFGYEKGAFTGASQRKIGRIESAAGGTLFLDEIGDLPYDQQVNLLRYLEDSTIMRVGGTEKIAVDVRIIAATHVDLKEAIRKKEFREDLYYRLRVLQIKTPALRLRENDIELLAWYYFNKYSKDQNYQAKGFQADALYLIKNYDWPGNVRELMNCIRHALVISENRLLSARDLGLERRGNKSRVLKTLDNARADADRESIISSLRFANNNVSHAAQTLNISRVSLYRLIDKYQIVI